MMKISLATLILCSFCLGQTIPSAHPRIWWTPSRITTAQAWYASNPFTPSTATIANADQWAFHYIVTGTATDCTANAIPVVVAYQIALSEIEGVASDNSRYNGEIAALVYDWCWDQLTMSDQALLRDRWGGAVSSAGDPAHSPTDLASVAGSKILTSASNPFLANMAGNNVIRIASGTNFVPGIYGIVTLNSAGSVTLDKDPTNGSNAVSGSGRISGYIDSIRQNAFAAATTSPGSNYSWGAWRNEIEWGIALTNESSYTAIFFDDAIGPSNSRWTTFSNYAAGSGPWAAPSNSEQGGIFSEGSEYGRYQWWYMHLALPTLALMGRDLFTETTWFKEAICYLIYATTVAPTSDQNSHTYYQIFPFNDDEGTNAPSIGYPIVGIFYYGDMMQEAAEKYSSIGLGKYASQWLSTISPGFTNYVSSVASSVSTLPFTGLPLDYYAPGMGMLFTKNTWSSSASMFRIIAGQTANGGHTDKAAGDFGLLRNGVWLSKEMTAYGDAIVCTYGVTCSSALDQGHNALLIGPTSSTTCNIGQAQNNANGFGRTIRLESQQTYSYIAIDFSTAFRATGSSQLCRDDNPYAGTVQREALFIKPLETVVLFDRMLSVDDRRAGDTHPALSPSSAIKTVMIHSPVAPSISTNTVTWDNSGQTLKLYTLLPASPTYTNIDEGNFTGHKTTPNLYQQRLEITDTGSAQSYELNILQARPTSGGVDFTSATVTDNGTSYTVTLQHPTLGNASLVLVKGASSTGGQFGYASSGPPVLSNLNASIETMTVTDNGPVWGNTIPSSVLSSKSPTNGKAVTH